MSVVVTYEQFEFMDMVREHDNPMGATPDLMTCFDLSRSEASTVLSAWCDTYSSLDDCSHTKESRQARVDKANAERARSISDIAVEIFHLWGKKINYAAKPYLDAMLDVDKPDDIYGVENGKTQVLYFLSNASTWHGEDARRIKAELKQIVGIK